MSKITLLLSLILSICSITSCGGGGGGGGDFTGAAQVGIEIRPSTVDVGDNIQIRTFITRIHPDGIALKFKFPSELSYVPQSAFLDSDGKEIDFTPEDNATVEESTFLVFYVSPSQLGDNEFGEFTFELEARGDFENQKIEVDPDVDDPRIDNNREFDSEDPQFVAEDEANITVKG